MILMRIITAFVACVIAGAASVSAQDTVDGYAPRTFVGANGMKMPYRIFVPDEQRRARPLPVVVYLHGAGGIGSDNLKQISGGNTTGTRVWVSREAQARHPAFVIAPQLPSGSWDRLRSEDELSPYAQLVLELLENVSKEFSVDRNRIYLTGQSLGGYGTWDLITKRPEVFAAAVPLCGGGVPSRVHAIRHLPIWAFHGAADEVVRVDASRGMVDALRAVKSPIKYTEYPDVGHDVWLRAYAERELATWLFAQRRAPR